jgi:predicted dehydrogenase
MDINYGLAGLGMISRNHLIGIRSIPIIREGDEFKVNLKALFTTHPDKNVKEAKLIGFEEIVDTMENLCQVDSLDLIDICTPNHLHREQVILAAKYGKKIYCEKPLGLNGYETNIMAEAVKEKNLKNQVALVMRFLPAFASAHAILKMGFLGSIYSFRGEMFHSSYLDPQKKMSWRLEKEKSGGGALIDLGIHVVDLIRFLLGEIKDVSASTKTVVGTRKDSEGKQSQVNVDDWALLSLRTFSGIQGSVEASRVAAGRDGTRISIYGDKGSLHLDLDKPYSYEMFDENLKRIYLAKEDLIEDDFYREAISLYPDPKVSLGTMVDLHLTGLLWFFKSILNGNTVNGTPTFYEAHKDQLVIDAAYESATNGGACVSSSKVY